MQSTLAERGKAPKRLIDPDYRGPLNHAYHFDAVGFAAVLAEHGQTLGVRRHLGTVEQVTLDEHGAIAQVVTAEHGAMTADLYVDCTGQAATLIGATLHSPFHPCNDVLFADRAVTLQVPHASADAAIAPYTLSTAQEAGWIWDIALQQRRGVGYVYSSRHSEAARAEATLRRYVGSAGDALQARHLQFQAGHRPEPWRANCVAIGLAGGFLEPLESTGIALIELGAYLLTHLMPGDSADLGYTAAHFNRMMDARYTRIIDFLKMHYCLSQRTDSAFWIDNRHPGSIPQTLKERLALWRHRPPHRLDFVTDLEMFLPASWQYVLYGMEFVTDLEPMRDAYPHMAQAQREFGMIQRAAAQAMCDLPDHRALLDRLCASAASAA
jgi:tryptophan halogenase